MTEDATTRGASAWRTGATLTTAVLLFDVLSVWLPDLMAARVPRGMPVGVGILMALCIVCAVILNAVAHVRRLNRGRGQAPHPGPDSGPA